MPTIKCPLWSGFSAVIAELSKLFADGRIRPHIGARFPLTETAAALRYVADRKVLGKVIIDVP